MVELAPGEDGRRVQRWLHAPTGNAILELQRQALRERDTGTGIDPTKPTLGEFVRQYYETVSNWSVSGAR